MSSSFVNSHQHVGLNRVGKYYKTVPEKGPPNCRQDAGDTAGETPALRNEPWRRWTGIVGDDEHRLSWKQRKRGIRRLLKQIERRIVEHASCAAEAIGQSGGMPHNWGGDVDGWARTQSAGRTLESICIEFGISPEKLSSLTREYNSMSAQDVIDGYKLGVGHASGLPSGGLKMILLAQLREAAFYLWGPPGDFAQRRCMRLVAARKRTRLRAFTAISTGLSSSPAIR